MTARTPKEALQSNRDCSVSSCVYSFGACCLRQDGTLYVCKRRVPITPKEQKVLEVLLEHAGQIVSKEELQRRVWEGLHVSEGSLPRLITSLRAHLDCPDAIQTHYKRGYRFAIHVLRAQESGPKSTGEANDTRSSDGSFETVNSVEQGDLGFFSRPSSTLTKLAVVPFVPGEGVPPAFGPGLAEDTLLHLGRQGRNDFRLIARDSTFTLAARSKSAQEIGQLLQADLVLAGLITALPAHFRLRIELIRVADTVQLWFEDFLIHRDSLQDAGGRLARRVLARFRNTFFRSNLSNEFPLDRITQPENRTDKRDGEAYAAYLLGSTQLDTVRRHYMQDGVLNLERSVELEPDLLAPRVRLVHGYLTQANYGFMLGAHAAELARIQAKIILARSAQCPSVTAALAWIHLYHERDPQAAAAAMELLPPGRFDARTVFYRARYAFGRANSDEAIRLLSDSAQIDPYSEQNQLQLAWMLHLAGDQAAAVEQAQRLLMDFPQRPGALAFGSMILAAAQGTALDARGSFTATAMQAAEHLVQIAPSIDLGNATLAYAQARSGNLRAAEAQLNHQHWLSRERFVMTTFHAPALVELKNFDAAIDILEVADRQRCPWLLEILADPRLKTLHREPRFQRLQRAVQFGYSGEFPVSSETLRA